MACTQCLILPDAVLQFLLAALKHQLFHAAADTALVSTSLYW